MNVQLKKGVLELCVLSMLNEQDCYGYEISETISKKIDISDGTIYPILRKLKSLEHLETYLEENSGGPPRKYYKITDTGKKEFKEKKDEYLDFSKKVNSMLEGDFDE